MLVMARDGNGGIVLWDLERRMISAPFCGFCAGRLAFTALLGRLPTPEPQEIFYPDGGSDLTAIGRADMGLLVGSLPPRILDHFVDWFVDGDREDGHYAGPCQCDLSLHEHGGEE